MKTEYKGGTHLGKVSENNEYVGYGGDEIKLDAKDCEILCYNHNHV